MFILFLSLKTLDFCDMDAIIYIDEKSVNQSLEPQHIDRGTNETNEIA